MAPASCKSSKKMLNPRGLDKHEELFRFVPVRVGSEFKFMPFQGEKLEGLFSHSKTFMWQSRQIINMCLLLLKLVILVAVKSQMQYTH